MHIKPIKTQKITENIYSIQTLVSNFYLYTDGENTLCFDTGYNPFIIKRALKKLNILPASVTDIFLTHTDFDHTGGINTFNRANIFLSVEEEKMITFKKPRLLFAFNKPIRRSYQLLNDGDVKKIGKITIKAISTPGHTIGSMSYLVDGKTLFTGDTLSVNTGSIKPFFFLQNMSNHRLRASIDRIKAISGVEIICTGHSGYIRIK